MTLQTHSYTGQAVEGILDANVLNVPNLEKRSVHIANVPYATLDSILNVKKITVSSDFLANHEQLQTILAKRL